MVAELCFPFEAVMVTVACGITAPVWSMTLPLSVAFGAWANAAADASKKIIRKALKVPLWNFIRL